MNALLVAIAVATLGIDVGWQRLPEGGMMYIIQLDPQTLEALRAGQPIESDIPAVAGEVRSYRIVVGQARLPREAPPSKPSPPAPEEPAKPWLPMTLTLIVLFASVGANVYLGWIVVEFRRRCRGLLPLPQDAASRA
jgi:hypothetical protein